MNFKDISVHQLVDLRDFYRLLKDWEACDLIRDYLDTQHVFIFDTSDSQEVYYGVRGTRQDVIDKINRDKRSEAQFDAWLFSTKESYKSSLKIKKI